MPVMIQLKTMIALKKSLSENSDMNIRKMILQKFIKRVEIGSDSVKIHWNVDKEFYENELSQAKACGTSNLLKFSRNVGSNSLTNGALRGTLKGQITQLFSLIINHSKMYQFNNLT